MQHPKNPAVTPGCNILTNMKRPRAVSGPRLNCWHTAILSQSEPTRICDSLNFLRRYDGQPGKANCWAQSSSNRHDGSQVVVEGQVFLASLNQEQLSCQLTPRLWVRNNASLLSNRRNSGTRPSLNSTSLSRVASTLNPLSPKP